MASTLTPGPAAVLVPVKAFADAKLRLAPALDARSRAGLARRMAEHVLRAAAPLPIAVVCDDPDVATWAGILGVPVIWEPGQGLNGAVEAGVAAFHAAGVRRAVVAHADLPLAGPLAWVAGFDGVTLVPDHRDDGTNVMCVPAGSGFRFAYGPGSFKRHGATALSLGLSLRVVRDPQLGHDVDVPADLTSVDLEATCP